MGKAPELLEPATRRLALASAVVGILAVTLLPERAGLLGRLRGGAWPALSASSLVQGLTYTDAADVVLNVLLFLPFGAFAVAGTGSPRRQAALAALAGTLLSAGVELAQGALPGRYPSLADVVCNGLGAWLGARWMLAWAARGVAVARDA